MLIFISILKFNYQLMFKNEKLNLSEQNFEKDEKVF